MKINIVSAIYNDLYGTSLGGRQGRIDHYMYSLKSIMKISDATFHVYTNDPDRISLFFNDCGYSNFFIYTDDLYNTIYKEKINRIKNIEDVKKSERCIELQYSKLEWINNHLKDSDYTYWIDAGLCYSGLIPDKYLKINTGYYYDRYYSSNIFSNKFMHNLIKESDRILVCAKENVRNFWENTIPYKYYKEYDASYHVIGGLFGGKSDMMKELIEKFRNLVTIILDNENHLYSEEHILSCLFVNNRNIFNPQFFDIWWHEDNAKLPMGSDEKVKLLLDNNKSFYKILEKFI